MSRPPLRTALDSGWLLQIAFVVAFVEVAVRIGLGRAVHPFLYLLAPPVAAVVGFGWLASGIRTRVLDERRRYAVDSPEGVLGRLLVVAVVGHAFAVVVGLAAFLLLDTPVQAGLYWLGREGRQPFVALAWPVVGVLAGTVLAWTLPALVVAGVSEGLGLRRATASALAAVRSRAVVPVVGVHLLAVVGVVCATAVGTLFGLAASSLVLFFVLTAALAVLVVTIPLGVAMLAHIGTVRALFDQSGESASGPDDDSRLEWPAVEIPVARLAVAAVLVASLATLAGGARMTELRPVDSPAPLGENPDEMYATALDNTLAGSYTGELVRNRGTENERTVTWQVDRADRQLHWAASEPAYVSTGTQAFRSASELADAFRVLLTDDTAALETGDAHSPPNYFRFAREPAAALLIETPSAVTGWERVGTDGDEVTLELTDREQVLGFVAPTVDPERVEEVNESEMRAVIDTEQRRLLTLDVQFDARLEPDAQIAADERYTFEPGADVGRPDELGAPSPEAYVWRLLLY